MSFSRNSIANLQTQNLSCASSGTPCTGAGQYGMSMAPGVSLVGYLGHGPVLGHFVQLHTGPVTLAALATAVIDLVCSCWD